MLTVGSSLATGLALLQAVQAGPSSPVSPSASALEQPAPAATTGSSKFGLSAAASDAMLRVAELSTVTAPVEPSARVRQEIARSVGIPADKIAWLETLGADTWVLREPPAIDDTEFEQQVLDSMVKSGTAKLEGFAEAREDGSLEIQRASEVPELGYKSFQVTLYKNAAVIGGAGFSTANTEHWMELRRSGIFAATGSVEGNDYVATWAMSPEAGGIQSRARAYAAA